MSFGILIVDVQKDFLPGGALAVRDGDRIIEPINELLKSFPNAPLYLSRDWHPKETAHFKPTGPWPPHCVQETEGAEFPEELNFRIRHHVIISKGMEKLEDNKYDDSYSAFRGRMSGMYANMFSDRLQADRVTSLIICGLATDYCVKATVLDALACGINVFVYTPGCKAVGDWVEEYKAFETMKNAGAMFLTNG